MSLASQTLTRKRPRFFYGWVIVAILGLTNAVAMGMGGFNYGLFIKPMGDDLGIGRAVFGWAQTARQVAGAVTSPFLGPLLDRFGVRIILPVTMVVMCLAIMGLSALTEGWQVIAMFACMGAVGMVGPTTLTTSVPVARWFVRGRGQATAITVQGTAVGGLILMPLTQYLIDTVGWRNTWLVMAGIGAVVIPLGLIFLRRQPEDIGLLPDGDANPRDLTTTGPVVAPVREVSWTFQEVKRTATFWRLVFVFSVVLLGQMTLGVHRIPGFMDRGLDPKLVSYATAFEPAMAGIAMFALGFLVDRFPLRYLGTLAFAILAVAIFLTLSASDPITMFLATGLFGVGAGSGMLLQNYIWAAYYGRAHLGSIRGFVQPITLLCAGIGAPAAGYVRDATGSYNSVWIVGLALVIIGAVVFATSSPPGRLARHDA